MRDIPEILAEIRKKHYPDPPSTVAELRQFEESTGYALPADMRAFYQGCNGVSLFRKRDDYPHLRLMSVAELCPARVAIYGTDSDKYGPADCYVFCDRGDGDYVGINLTPNENSDHEIVDCWHEAWPDKEYCAAIAKSFTEFVNGALDSNGDSLFWFRRRVE